MHKMMIATMAEVALASATSTPVMARTFGIDQVTVDPDQAA